MDKNFNDCLMIYKINDRYVSDVSRPMSAINKSYNSWMVIIYLFLILTVICGCKN